MNLADLFRSVIPGNSQPGQTQQNQTPQNIPPGQQDQNPIAGTQSTSGTSNNGVVPQINNPSGSTGNSDQQSPFADFKDIWQTNETPGANVPMFANLDAKKLQEAAAKVNFAQSISQDQLQKIQAGGPEAMQAFATAMNQVAQSVYAQSAMATTKIVEQALGKQQEKFDANFPSMVKKFSVNENLQTKNPLLSDPALQPFASALTEQLTRKHPGASSSEIESQVQKYFSALGETFGKSQPSQMESQKSSDDDWSKFFGPQN